MLNSAHRVSLRLVASTPVLQLLFEMVKKLTILLESVTLPLTLTSMHVSFVICRQSRTDSQYYTETPFLNAVSGCHGSASKSAQLAMTTNTP